MNNCHGNKRYADGMEATRRFAHYGTKQMDVARLKVEQVIIRTTARSRHSVDHTVDCKGRAAGRVTR